MNYFEELTQTRQRSSKNMAQSINSMIVDIRKENIKQSLSDLENTSHRQDFVATIDDVMYYDDSKSESVNATWFTFDSVIEPVIWIAGGTSPKADISELASVAEEKVKVLIAIGEAETKLRETFGEHVKEIYGANDIEDAVEMASIIAQEGDVVLFSPACKSSEPSEGFAERGNRFIESVKQLEK